MGLVGIGAVVLVALVIIGAGASNFYSDVSSGVHKVISYVEKTPVLKNLTSETKQFVTEQGSDIAHELSGMFVITNAFAHEDNDEQSNYDSGWNRGCDDAEISYPGDMYINQPGNGPSDHTDAFMVGYDDGYYSCGGTYDDEEPEQNQDQSQAQTQSNDNNNDNSLSQSQATTIYICKENGCTAQ